MLSDILVLVVEVPLAFFLWLFSSVDIFHDVVAIRDTSCQTEWLMCSACPSVLCDCLLPEHLKHGFINPKIVLNLKKSGFGCSRSVLIHAVEKQLHRVEFCFRWSFHRFIESQVGRDLKDQLAQLFLAKARSRQDGPAGYPAKSYKCPMLRNPTLPWEDYSNGWLFSLWKIFFLVISTWCWSFTGV